MATTPIGAHLADRFYLHQTQLRSRFLIEVLALYPLLREDDLRSTAPTWLRLMVDLILRYRRMSRDLGAEFYIDYRHAENGPWLPRLDFEIGDIDVPNVEAIEASLRATGPVGLYQRLTKGWEPTEAQQTTLTDVNGSSSRHMLNGGRNSVIELTKRDELALGWARKTGPNPCYFCAMLASRGPVYHSRQSAGFQPHSHCRCVPVPVFTQDDPWPDNAEAYEELWYEVTPDYDGQDKIKAFRREYERRQRAGLI